MRCIKFFAAALSGVVLVSLCACGNKENSNTKTAAAGITNFEIRTVIKSASQDYRVTYPEGDSTGLKISASIQWPEEIGGNSLTALQDSLTAVLQTAKADNIDQALTAYVNNPDILADGDSIDYQAERVDTLPSVSSSFMVYDISTSAAISEVNTKYVTYQVENYSYTGGAHPNTVSSPFTYDLAAGQVLTFDNTFLPGYESKLLEIIKNTLAAQLGVSGPNKLAEAGIFTDQMFLSHDIFVNNGQLVFHYNPYDIAPYALGEINVSIPPYQLRDMLTTEVQNLLD